MGPKLEELLVQAETMQQMTAEILAVIDKYKGQENVKLIMGSLGATLGTIANATGRPDSFLDLTFTVARKFADGDWEEGKPS